MSLLRNVQIKTILTVLISASLITILVFGLLLSQDKYKHYTNLNRVGETLNFSIALSELVHELQKERGASAGFLGSKGTNFSTTLSEQRKLTDAKKEIVDKLTHNVFSKEIQAKLDDMTNELSKLQETRQKIIKQKISLSKSIEFYSILNDKIIKSISLVALSNKEATKPLTPYMNFVNAKEKAGIQRALGSGRFGVGFFDKDSRIFFENLSFAQNEFIKQFLYTTDEQTRLKYNEIVLNSAPYKQISSYIKIVSNSKIEEPLDVNAKKWFDTMTEKINRLQIVEKFMAENIISHAEEQATMDFVALVSFIAIILFIILVLEKKIKLLKPRDRRILMCL